MRLLVLLATALIAGASPSFASCDLKGENDQSVCAARCDETLQLMQQASPSPDNPLSATARAVKKACDATCGCPENSGGL